MPPPSPARQPASRSVRSPPDTTRADRPLYGGPNSAQGHSEEQPIRLGTIHQTGPGCRGRHIPFRAITTAFTASAASAAAAAAPAFASVWYGMATRQPRHQIFASPLPPTPPITPPLPLLLLLSPPSPPTPSVHPVAPRLERPGAGPIAPMRRRWRLRRRPTGNLRRGKSTPLEASHGRDHLLFIRHFYCYAVA